MKMKKMVIGIHGLGNKPPANLLREWWLQSMHEGLIRQGFEAREIPFDLVFWADILHPQLLDAQETDEKLPQFIQEPYLPSPSRAKPDRESLRAKVFQYIDRQLDSIFLNQDATLNLTGVTDAIIGKYFGDLESYFKDDCVSLTDSACSARRHIQNRLLTVLKKYSGYDILLIGHSMGSLVAFDILSSQCEKFKINTFVTIGSPLGLPFIMGRELARQRLQNPEQKRPLIPACIQRHWYNLADIEDKVAMDHALNDDYLPNQLGVAVEDRDVFNDYESQGDRNPHKSFGYLRTPEFSHILEYFLSNPLRQSWLSGSRISIQGVRCIMRSIWNNLRKG